MTHLAFVTLFLGLTLGPQRVDLKVTGPADHVELRLDGRPVGVIKSEPWASSIDFGTRLLPHHLVAVAFDQAGTEVARTEQAVNLPRSSAEVQMVLDRDAAGKPSTVQVLWQSLEADRPKDTVLLLDSAPLRVDGHLRAEIPEIDITRPHLLSVRTFSPSGVVAETELAFGGGLETESGRQLTAIPIRVLAHKPTPTAAELEQWLTIGDAPARVVGVEELPGDVIIVRHPMSVEASIRLDPSARVQRRSTMINASGSELVHHPRPLAQFMWPVPAKTGTSLPTYLMPYTHPFEFSSADDFRSLLTNVSYMIGAGHLRFADAVAVAGIQAMSIRRPRAVILLLGDASRDDSELQPAQVREYLRSIGVPLFVWTLSGGDGGWGEVTDVSTPQKYSKAFIVLKESLQSQRIVWVDGNHLPADIEVAPAARGVIEAIALR